MKYKLLATLLAAAMLVSPVLGFWHPPEEEYPQHPAFAVLINGKYTWTFKEPADNFCDTFTVEVGILNVTDLFGYEFKLWWDTTYFNLVSYTVEQTWPSQFQWLPAADYDLSAPYQQVVVAMDPSLGVDGDIKVATLTFHINNDVCYHQGTVSGWFYLTDVKASNSCSGKIELCDTHNAYWEFVPKKPKIYIDPATINCSKVGTTFEVTVVLKDIVKMTDFSVCIQWNGKVVMVDSCGIGFYTALLYTKKENVAINEDVFPKANRTTSTITVTSPKCGVYQADPVGSVCVNVVMDPSFPLINGTVWLFKVTFTQCDPWYCGAQPLYTDNGDHTWTLEKGSTDIYFVDGYISVKCPTAWNMLIGVEVDYANAHYDFIPIPGDLDGSGHTGSEDLLIEAAYYGTVDQWCVVPAFGSANAYNYFYDLNKDGFIDIYDLVIVAKNFCRDKP
jgi:hypothetical protein